MSKLISIFCSMICVCGLDAVVFDIVNDTSLDLRLVHKKSGNIALADNICADKHNSFKVAIDGNTCSKKALNIFSVVCDGNEIAQIIFGTQMMTIAPVLKIIDYSKGNLFLQCNGDCRKWQLLLE